MVAVGVVILLLGVALAGWPLQVLRASSKLRPFGDPGIATPNQVRAWRISGLAVLLLGALVATAGLVA